MRNEKECEDLYPFLQSVDYLIIHEISFHLHCFIEVLAFEIIFALISKKLKILVKQHTTTKRKMI